MCGKSLPLHFSEYLSDVLAGIVKIDTTTFEEEVKDFGIRAPTTQKLLECSPSAMVHVAGTLPPKVRLFVFQEIGNICIVISSFKEMRRKKSYTKSHLINLGTSCYRWAGHVGKVHNLHSHSEVSDFNDYADNFEIAVDVLKAMQAKNRIEYFHNPEGKNISQLF